MMKQKGYHDFQGNNFWISFYFFQKFNLRVFVDLENFSPDTLRVNFEVLKLLHLCMDCHVASLF